MKKHLLAISVSLCLVFTVSAQQEEKCLTEILFREEAAKDPLLLKKRQALEIATEKHIADKQNGHQTASAVKIIPVVFHIIHEYGTENISRAQCLDQIKILNRDFQRLNADTTATPVPFRSKSGKLDVEFRLAQLDPSGNCTDGIVRFYSPLTNNARNNVKALSYWPSNKYLNIWVVKSIENFSNTPGTILGYAQFPGGVPATDGIVMKHDYTGSIGSAAASAYKGRTCTHEIGHWFNLRHIWGDDTDCSGSDQVGDTPNQQVASSGCPSFPKTDPCTPTGDGIMFMNYMDYSDGACQNMFSSGQCARMDAALSTDASRSNLHSPANLVATGTDGSPAQLCAPKADFKSNTNRICIGKSIVYTDVSWRGPAQSRKWYFPGGIPATSTDSIPTVQYAVPGTYDAKLVVINSAGTDSIIKNSYVIVSPDTAKYSDLLYSEGFETVTSIPNADWLVNNLDNGTTWQRVTGVAASGSACLKLANFGAAPGQADELISPSFNMAAITNPVFTFKVAYAQKASTDADTLKVFISTDCGQTWLQRYNEKGNKLQTTGSIAYPTAFTPTATQWREEKININPYLTSTNVRIKFRFSGAGGNNIYLDDINIKSPVGIDEVSKQQFEFNVYPNPVESVGVISFKLKSKQHVDLTVYDVLGRDVLNLSDNRLDAGDHQFAVKNGADLKPGIYFVKLTVAKHIQLLKKIIIE